MGTRTTGWMLAAGMATGLLWAPVLPAEDPSPGLRVESTTIDVGEVIAGQTGVATFTFHNDSAADVRILRAKPS